MKVAKRIAFYLASNLLLMGLVIAVIPSRLAYAAMPNPTRLIDAPVYGRAFSAGGKVFFSSYDPVHANELWVSDGTVAGTHMITNISESVLVPNGETLAFNNMLYFPVSHLPNGASIWQSDGTTEGTRMAIDPGDANVADYQHELIQMNGQLCFTAHSVYCGDGTPEGTQRLTPTETSFAGSLMKIDGKLYFEALDATRLSNTRAIWESDGTVAGTHKTLLHPFLPSLLTKLNGKFYFSSKDGTNNNQYLWESDGTAAGTHIVTTDVVLTRSDGYIPARFVTTSNLLFFWGDDGVHGYQLWKSDGTTSGTQVVATVNQGQNGFLHPDCECWKLPPLAVMNNVVYFRANDGIHGSELWRSDGTAAGTQLVNDFNPGPESSYPAELTPIGQGLVLAAIGPDGGRFWLTNGTAAGTHQVPDITVNEIYWEIHDTVDNPGRHIADLDGTPYIALDYEGTRGLWKMNPPIQIEAPTGLNGASPTNQPALTWTPVAGADHYNIYRDTVLVGTSSTPTYSDSSPFPDGDHSYKVTAVDALGGESEPSSPVTLQVDKTSPSVDTISWAINSNPLLQGQNATLSADATDNLSGVAGVYFTIDGGAAQPMIYDTASNRWKATFGSNLAVNTYNISVFASDAAGNTSPIKPDVLAVYNAANGYVTGHEWVLPSANDVLPIARDTSNHPAKIVLGFTNIKAATSTTPSSGSFDVRYVVRQNRDEFNLSSTIVDWLVVPDDTHASILGYATLTTYVDGTMTVTPNVAVRFDLTLGASGAQDHVVMKIFSPGVDPNTGSPSWFIDDNALANVSQLKIKP